MSLTNRVLKIALATLLACALIASWWWLHRTDMPEIQRVKVVGEYTHLSKRQLADVAMPFVQNGFFSVPVQELRERILRLAWVADCSIIRQWPDTLVIKITEEKPIARWGKSALVNQDGDIFFPEESNRMLHLPLFAGPIERVSEMLMKYQIMAQDMRELGLTIAEVHLTDRHSWWLRLDNGMEILLGREDALQRLDRLKRSYRRIIGSHGDAVARVDLRYTNGLAIKWAQRKTV